MIPPGGGCPQGGLYARVYARTCICVPTHTYYSHALLQSRIAIYNPYSASYCISPVMDITHIPPPIPLGITKSPMYALYVYLGHVCTTCMSCTGHVIMCTRMVRGQNNFFSLFLRSPTGILKGSILAGSVCNLVLVVFHCWGQ